MNIFSRKLRVGVDIGSTNIKIAGISQKGKDLKLHFYDVIDLVKEYSLKSLSEINDDLYIEQLRKLVSKHHVKNALVSTMLPANSAIIRSVNLDPDQTESKVIETIQAEFRQVGFEETEDLQIACHQMEKNTNPEQQIAMLACAIPDSVVKRYRRILKESGLKARVLDLDALGIYNSFYYFNKNEISNPVTIVQIGSHYTICLIMHEESPPFFYVIKQGGNDITNNIKNDLRLDFFKAEKMKLNEKNVKWTDIDFCQNSHLYKIYRTFTEDLVSEVKRCIQHFQSYAAFDEMGSVYITGGEARSNILVNLLHKHLQIEVKTWNPLKYFKISGSENEYTQRVFDGLHLAPTIGTLIRGD